MKNLGAELELSPQTRIRALDLDDENRHPADAPQWLATQRCQPIRQRSQQIGTLVVLEAAAPEH
jgi:hypothetical protein